MKGYWRVKRGRWNISLLRETTLCLGPSLILLFTFVHFLVSFMDKIPYQLNTLFCSPIDNLKHCQMAGVFLGNIYGAKVATRASFTKAKLVSKYHLFLYKLRTQTSSHACLPSTTLCLCSKNKLVKAANEVSFPSPPRLQGVRTYTSFLK